MKKIIKSFLFLLILAIILICIFLVCHIGRNPITEFYKEPKNSLDIIYLGGSNAFMQFNPSLAYKEYGFTTGMLSFESQPFIATKYLIEEAKKYQKSKLYIIDISKIAEDYSELDEVKIRKVTDSIKKSENRTNLINKILSYTDIPKENYINYYFDFLAYHDIWKSPMVILYNIFGNKIFYKGFL